jgi:hypothetical protein
MTGWKDVEQKDWRKLRGRRFGKTWIDEKVWLLDNSLKVETWKEVEEGYIELSEMGYGREWLSGKDLYCCHWAYFKYNYVKRK